MSIIFFTLQNFLFASMYSIGRVISKRRSYWKYAIFIILFYTLVEGLRWGRGIDYNLYFYAYENIANGLDTNFEPLYIAFCHTLIELGIPYQGYILICSFLLIFSWLLFLKRYAFALHYILPLFFIMSVMTTENLVRQYLGFSFVLIGLKFLMDKRYWLFLFFSFIGLSLHNGLLFVIPIFIVLYFLKRPLLSPQIAIPLYLLLWIIWNNSYMLYFTSFFNDLGIERFEGYIENSKEVFTGEKLKIETGTLETVRLLIVHIYFIVLGYKLVQKKKELLYCYNVALFGTLLFPMAKTIELFSRINYTFVLFQPIIIGSILYFVFKRIYFQNKYIYIFSLFVVFIFVYLTLKRSLISDFWYNSFIWDAQGKDTIPLQYFKD